MEIIKVEKYRINKKALDKAVSVLRIGGIVVHPSESSYGLAADPTNPEAMKRLFALKERSIGNAILIIAGSKQQAAEYVQLTRRLTYFADRYWPGPLTIVGSARQTMFVHGEGESKDVAVRVPASIWARELATAFGKPITSTSANISGEPPAFSVEDICKIFSKREQKPDLALDVGVLPTRAPSTVIRQQNNQIEILREGRIKIKS